MGNSASAENTVVGYHILQVQPNSPGSAAGLKSFFDFIVVAQGKQILQEDNSFIKILQDNLDKEVKLTIYNSRTEQYRECSLTPSNSWGGQGLAGISIRFCSVEHAKSFVWHVVKVHPNSPASVAGLQTDVDYVIGTPNLLFNDSNDFFKFIEANEGKKILLYVYNTAIDNIRVITIVPNSSWGGEGSMGCDIGFGYLHQIPSLPSGDEQGHLKSESHSHGHGSHSHAHSHENDHGVKTKKHDKKDEGHGHSHSHSHGHGHDDHDHDHEHDHEHEHEHDDDHDHNHDHEHDHNYVPTNNYNHDHIHKESDDKK